MYLDKVTLHNIRGFKHLEFSLGRGDGKYAGWTVFTGDNGSGKSTLLKAIALGLSGAKTAQLLQPNFQRWIRDGCADAQIKVNGETRDANHPFSTSLDLKKSDGQDILDSYRHGKESLAALFKRPAWFVCGYGPFRRISGSSPEAARLMLAPETERFITMFQEAASLFEVDRWLRDLNYKKLEGKTDESAQLEVVLEILRDDLMPNQITVDRVDSDGLWLKDRNGVQLAWSDMSDGYRSAIALLADILRHLITAYGLDGLTARGVDGKLCITRSGVVLIDEIDAHLHPEWQREIGFWLKRHFPNIQFLVTTHSPIICQAADPNGLFVLPEPGSGEPARALTADEYQKVIAARPDTILLSAAFGLENTRSPRAVENRARFAKLQAKKRAGATLTKTEIECIEQLRSFADTGEEE